MRRRRERKKKKKKTHSDVVLAGDHVGRLTRCNGVVGNTSDLLVVLSNNGGSRIVRGGHAEGTIGSICGDLFLLHALEAQRPKASRADDLGAKLQTHLGAAFSKTVDHVV